MRSLTVSLCLLLGALPVLPTIALAQDDPAEKPAEEVKAAGAEKDDGEEQARKVDAAADALLKAWGKAMHLPTHMKADEISSSATATNAQLFYGGELTVNTTWKRGGELELDVVMPTAMTERLPPQAVEISKNLFSTWSREAMAPVMISPDNYASDYHVGLQVEGEEKAVKLVPYADDTAAELQLLYFDEKGLCERRMMIPRVDPNDPAQAMFVGAEIETTFGYEEVGERSVLKRSNMLTPMGDILFEYEYYEVTDGSPMLKSLSMTTPFSPEPVVVTFKNYEIDGKALADDTDGDKKDGEHDDKDGDGKHDGEDKDGDDGKDGGE